MIDLIFIPRPNILILSEFASEVSCTAGTDTELISAPQLSTNGITDRVVITSLTVTSTQAGYVFIETYGTERVRFRIEANKTLNLNFGTGLNFDKNHVTARDLKIKANLSADGTVSAALAGYIVDNNKRYSASYEENTAEAYIYYED